MKKFLTFLTTVLLSCSCFVACDCSDLGGSGSSGSLGGDKPVTNPKNRTYITHFDGYNQCLIFPAVTWDTTLHEGGKVINDWNEDSRYISEGTGSIKVSMNEKASDGTYWYKGRIEANNGFVSSVTSINGAKSISLDICNPGNTTIEVTIEIESASKAMVSVTKTCFPKQWTTVSTNIAADTYDIVNWYSITLKNTETSEPFTVYMDNFYLEF